jgi:hypothetical protein
MADKPTARIEVIVRNDAGEPSATAKVDPNDLANRNAAGETEAKPGEKDQPGKTAQVDAGGDRARVNKGSDDDDSDDDDSDDDDSDDDTDDSSMYDGDGKLTDHGAAKIAAATFAVPGKKQLPMHDAAAVAQSMKDFPKHEFDDADAKHGAFNRLKNKALAFGQKDAAAAFEKKHGGKLDQKDTTMDTAEIKALREKADKADARKEKLVAAKTKLAAETKRADDAEAALENMKREATKRADAAQGPAVTTDQAKLDAKLELLDMARSTGAKVDTKMSDIDIKKAVIKHVDGADAPENKSEGYYDALFDGAVKRAKQDAADTSKGSAALAAARAAAEGARANTHLDGSTDEEAAKAALAAASRQMINQPSAGREQLARKAR